MKEERRAEGGKRDVVKPRERERGPQVRPKREGGRASEEARECVSERARERAQERGKREL